MKSVLKRVILFGVFLLIAVSVVAVIWNKVRRFEAEVYRTYSSPDGRFKVVVYRIPMPIAFAGQSGDASGYVQLQGVSGKVLVEKNVEMVQIIEPPVWSKTNVEIKLFADWILPK